MDSVDVDIVCSGCDVTLRFGSLAGDLMADEIEAFGFHVFNLSAEDLFLGEGTDLSAYYAGTAGSVPAEEGYMAILPGEFLIDGQSVRIETSPPGSRAYADIDASSDNSEIDFE